MQLFGLRLVNHGARVRVKFKLIMMEIDQVSETRDDLIYALP